MAVRAPVADLAEGVRTLERETSHYLCRVLRLREGDRFVAFDPSTRLEADAVVEAASGEAARVSIGAARPAATVAATDVVLVYGLAKGDKVDAVVRDAAELGATRVVVARTARCVVKVDDVRGAGKIARWRKIAEQAARQCGRADPPEVVGVLAWREALEAASGAEACFCLWERATEPLGPPLTAAIARGASLAFAVGPEGGLTDAEADEARALGFAPSSLGRFVLRTETVAAAVLGAVRVLKV